jgi:ATP-dependent Clp protease ATP-binding subunit ClpA
LAPRTLGVLTRPRSVFSANSFARTFWSQSQAWVDPKAQPDDDVLTKVRRFCVFRKKKKNGEISSCDAFFLQYCRDLTELAKAQKLDPVIGLRKELFFFCLLRCLFDLLSGRDDDVRRALTILARRSKNNALLVGDAGVGENCNCGGIAQRIVARRCP